MGSRRIRVALSAAWVVAFVGAWLTMGFTTDRFTVVFWIVTALVAFTWGTRPWWQAPLDWLPIIAFFVVYDYTRGLAMRIGLPVGWTWPSEVDRVLAFGHLPSAWLQGRLAQPHDAVPWWEAIVATVYLSHFIVPFVLGAVLWVRSRPVFTAYMVRLALVSAIGVVAYVLVPTAPPWAAARCTVTEVAAHPSSPACMDRYVPSDPEHTVIGPLTRHHEGYRPVVQRITTRGWDLVPGMHRTRGFIQSGIDGSNPVAAVPSLHAAGAMLVAAFLWCRVRRRWRPLLAAYPLAMGFSLVYGGDHYLTDVLLGWLAVAVVMVAAGWVDRRRSARGSPTGRIADANESAGRPRQLTS